MSLIAAVVAGKELTIVNPSICICSSACLHTRIVLIGDLSASELCMTRITSSVSGRGSGYRNDSILVEVPYEHWTSSSPLCKLKACRLYRYVNAFEHLA